MTDPRAYLADVLAKAGAATRAPWGHWPEAGSIEIFAADPDDPRHPALAPGTTSSEWILVSDVRPRLGWGKEIYEPNEPDAEFIASARTTSPAMARALIAVVNMLDKRDANTTGDEHIPASRIYAAITAELAKEIKHG